MKSTQVVNGVKAPREKRKRTGPTPPKSERLARQRKKYEASKVMEVLSTETPAGRAPNRKAGGVLRMKVHW